MEAMPMGGWLRPSYGEETDSILPGYCESNEGMALRFTIPGTLILRLKGRAGVRHIQSLQVGRR